MTDRYNMQNQIEHLQMKYVGTGHADLSRWEWATNIHRDSYASHIGHYSRLSYMAIADNESIQRTKYNMMMKMIQPCGKRPEKDEEMN
mmetsp:Transcript_39279/g.44720  ORF Transcript_39279/g.44720 Transcript_39279/m.44720 type:complete len:88 (+) Transcript_39279:43-306(+)|eukprot:CAMPEP_0115007364 /NCGR_PEP_ID=MMETSP0216-20121206/21126_1 /TAXON_ID=223996 /ORGANISM="Protocruzia adherens, Strain Boccale" /LENGTH=87 /DNA_ID=CAMNT_0002374273 /DNA_START=38 /DNA_END=301 /DNA_ORIENTATION=+